MSATEDESQNLDAGWDAEEPSTPGADEVDSAWDSLPPPPVSAAAVSSSSMPVATEEVDSGWDDAPAGAPAPAGGKRRPHRQRRQKVSGVVASVSPVLMPRPAEPTKKLQREHTRKLRAQEAQVKEQRKLERKAERAAEARDEAAARLRQAEAEERARKMRREARERAESEKPPAKVSRPKASKPTSSAKNSTPSGRTVTDSKRKEALASSTQPQRGLRVGVIVAVLVLAAIVAFLVLRK
jgi:hypothetical protein